MHQFNNEVQRLREEKVSLRELYYLNNFYKITLKDRLKIKIDEEE